MKNPISLIFLSLCIFVNVEAKVIPPNYNFSLDQLDMFLPGKKMGPIIEKYGIGDLMSREGATNVFRLFLKYDRYRFPVMVQVYNNTVLDFVADLPSYFLHDIYHQSLINRYGKQDNYHRVGEQAVYIWNDKANSRHVYAGACTITCFAVYYAARINTPPQGIPKYTSILERMVLFEQNKEVDLKR